MQFDVRKQTGKDGKHLNNFSITQIVKDFIEFLSTRRYSDLAIQYATLI